MHISPHNPICGEARLIYRSRARLERSSEARDAVLLDILTLARRNNDRSGLTGALLFDGRIFLQVLEGPLAAIERTYERIACDQRHTNIELIDLSMIQARDYTTWSMAMLDASDGLYAHLAPFLSEGGDTRCAELRQAVKETLNQTLLGPCDAMEHA